MVVENAIRLLTAALTELAEGVVGIGCLRSPSCDCSGCKVQRLLEELEATVNDD